MAIGSTTPLEKVAAEAGGRLWFQLYIWENPQLTADLVRRVQAAGYEALVVTIDVGLGTNREHNYRNGWGNPFKPSYRTVRDILLRPRWLFGTLLRYLTTTGMPRHANNPPEAKKIAGAHLRSKEGAVSWEDFKRLRDLWPGTIMVKGILRADDAEKAVEYGANGIVVSNHGGRVLDSAVATIDALPAIAKAVGERATVMIDSGIRRGSDIVKARALGAKAVLLGRPALWGTTVAGEAGAMHALKLIRREYELTMSHVGCRSADEIGPDVLALDGAPAAAIQ
jgi:isopentenyl diphosphate isomerase/L-lactate dehydrogenase-like FMN-dependent dehydrogenase